jgi:hypothetical protein
MKNHIRAHLYAHVYTRQNITILPARNIFCHSYQSQNLSKGNPSKIPECIQDIAEYINNSQVISPEG